MGSIENILENFEKIFAANENELYLCIPIRKQAV